MKSTLLAVSLSLVVIDTARAQFNPIPLTPGSFTKDVIVEKTAPPPAQSLVTANFDAGTNITGLASGGGTGGNQGSLYEKGAGTTAGSGLPYRGSIFTAFFNAVGTTHIYQMPSDYKQPNAVFIGGAGTVPQQVTSGTLSLTTPNTYDHLSILATAGNGPLNAQVTITYADGSQENQNIAIQDWFATNGTATNFTAFICNGNFQGSDGTFQNVNLNGAKQALERIRLYYNDLTLNPTTSTVVSNVTFTYLSGGRAGIFGISGSADGGATYNPLGVTGFTYDMIIEAPLVNTVTATVDAGTNKTGTTWFEQGYNLIVVSNTLNTGLPHPGATFTALSNANYTFQMASSYTTNDAMLIANQTGFASGTFTLTTPAPYFSLSFFEAAGNGPDVNNYTVTYADGTTQTGSLTVFDWFNNTPTNVAFQAKGRVQIDQLNNVNNSGNTNGTRLFYDTIALTNTTTAVSNVTFTYASGGRTSTLAVSGDSTGSGTFSPIAVTGYNADMIVEANAISNVTYRYYTTATMDQGTNNSANTWYEKGWNVLEPNSGLPPAGSTITSLNLPDHHYQLPASYSQPNAVYAESNNPIANITFATPSNYSAVSFLSANANGGIRIKVILNHDNGTSETNFFDSQDWFNGNPFAYNSAGRLNVDTRGANNYIPNSTNPRLYEAQFALQDTVHNVTGATLVWTTNASSTTTNFASATSRFVVLAVSGTLGAVAPIIGLSPTGTNVFENTNFTLVATVTGGTAPITNQWQKTSIGGSTWTNLVDGGDISGSTTTNLQFTHPSWTNTGDYRMVAMNVAGTSPTLTATVQVFSGLPDIATNTDSLSEFGNAVPDPVTEQVSHAIDGLVGADPAKWLDFGGSGGTAGPFVGPVGFVFSPQKGSTVAQAVRFFTANDTEGRDPADFMLEGSSDGGNTWATIVPDMALALPSTRNAAASAAKNPLTQAVQEVHFDSNTNGYATYRLTINNVKTAGSVNSMQIGEIELLGNLALVAPTITRQPISVVTVFQGASPTFSVVAAGPTPITYQWYKNVSTLINNATNSSYTFPSAQLTDDGTTFDCQVTDAYGTTVSGNVLLHVRPAPTNAYPTTIIADNPVAYWRLDEGPDDGNGDNGVVADDYVGGHNGIYTNVTLGVTGSSAFDTNTAVQFENHVAGPSYVGNISGITFATPTNTSGTFSIEAWVNGQQTQIGGAGLVTLGFGGGGEEFALDCGATSNNFRFYFRDAGGAAHNANDPAAASAPQPSADQTWHHLVGVVNEAATNQSLYVDGLLVASNNLVAGLGVLNPNPLYPLEIGARSQATTNPIPNLQFAGMVDEVAIYNYALTGAQVQNHYFAAGIAPRFLIAPTNVTASEGTTATFTSSPYGSPLLQIQWYNSDGSNPTTPLTGQTNSTLSFPNVVSNQNGTFYQVTVNNNYGGITSAPVLLTVISGPPQILTDLQPNYYEFGGSQFSLSINAGGTPPLSYYWFHNGTNIINGGPVSGANTSTLTIADARASDGGSYQCVVSNNISTTPSSTANVVVDGALEMDGGVSWTMQNKATYPSANVLQLTDGALNESGSSFYLNPVYIGAFTASFTYQDIGGGGADGVAFVAQNDPRGATALGGGGGGLGYSGITPSVAVEFNIFANNTVGYALRANGATGSPYTNTAPVSVASGDPINVSVNYINGILNLTLVDTVSNVSFTTNVAVNIPAIVGKSTAYVGITGADGGTASTQQVSNFKFVGLNTVQAVSTGGNLVISWPLSSGGYTLQSAADLAGPWNDVNAVVTVVNGQNQVTIPSGSGTSFFRLHVTVP